MQDEVDDDNPRRLDCSGVDRKEASYSNSLLESFALLFLLLRSAGSARDRTQEGKKSGTCFARLRPCGFITSLRRSSGLGLQKRLARPRTHSPNTRTETVCARCKLAHAV